MTSREIEYRGLVAASWDIRRGDTSAWPDRPFYLDLIREQGEPVLDVGCGTGRLLLDYRALGIDIDGVDNAPEMLAHCREKTAAQGLSVATYEQPMEALDLPRRYRVILVPSSSFQLLCDRDGARAALAAFVRHLQPGGLLVMSFMVPERRWAEWSAWARTSHRVDWGEGRQLRRYSRAWHNESEQLEHLEDRYEVTRGGELVESELNSRSPAMRWYTVAQAVALYNAAGFTDVRATADFSREPATGVEAVFCVTGVREG